jgi:hypothetical protein
MVRADGRAEAAPGKRFDGIMPEKLGGSPDHRAGACNAAISARPE